MSVNSLLPAYVLSILLDSSVALLVISALRLASVLLKSVFLAYDNSRVSFVSCKSPFNPSKVSFVSPASLASSSKDLLVEEISLLKLLMLA